MIFCKRLCFAEEDTFFVKNRRRRLEEKKVKNDQNNWLDLKLVCVFIEFKEIK